MGGSCPTVPLTRYMSQRRTLLGEWVWQHSIKWGWHVLWANICALISHLSITFSLFLLPSSVPLPVPLPVPRPLLPLPLQCLLLRANS